MTAVQSQSSRLLVGAWLLLALLGAIWMYDGEGATVSFAQAASEFLFEPLRELADHGILTRQFPFFLLLTALFAILLPASRTQPFFSRGFIHDLMWFLYKPVFVALVTVSYTAWLHSAIDLHLQWLKVAPLDSWPVWARLAVGLVLADFVFWLQHLLMHKVPLLWKFHKVHHSQRELNFFSNDRVHIIESPMWVTFQAIPLLFLSFNLPEIYLIIVFYKWQPVLIHANVRTNLGPLKYLLVTPQSHRVHHSLEPEHHDKNFGAVLTVWDCLFRTQVHDYDTYPDTGIEDDRFPIEQNVPWWKVPIMPLIQTVHPFREIAREFAQRSAARTTAGR